MRRSLACDENATLSNEQVREFQGTEIKVMRMLRLNGVMSAWTTNIKKKKMQFTCPEDAALMDALVTITQSGKIKTMRMLRLNAYYDD